MYKERLFVSLTVAVWPLCTAIVLKLKNAQSFAKVYFHSGVDIFYVSFTQQNNLHPRDVLINSCNVCDDVRKHCCSHD